MAAFVKSLDPKHLITVGLEGFYGSKSTENYGANPGDWAASLGSDFINNSAVKDIDFASVHAYPHSWLVTSTTTVISEFNYDLTCEMKIYKNLPCSTFDLVLRHN